MVFTLPQCRAYTPGRKTQMLAGHMPVEGTQTTREENKGGPPWICGQRNVRATAKHKIEHRQRSHPVPGFKIPDPAGKRNWARIGRQRLYRPHHRDGLFIFFFLSYLSSPHVRLPPPPELLSKFPWVRCLYGSDKLWDRTLDRYTRNGLPECLVSTKSGPPPETAQDRTQTAGLEGSNSTDHATATVLCNYPGEKNHELQIKSKIISYILKLIIFVVEFNSPIKKSKFHLQPSYLTICYKF